MYLNHYLEKANIALSHGYSTPPQRFLLQTNEICISVFSARGVYGDREWLKTSPCHIA